MAKNKNILFTREILFFRKLLTFICLWVQLDMLWTPLGAVGMYWHISILGDSITLFFWWGSNLIQLLICKVGRSLANSDPTIYGHLHSRGKIKTIHIQVNTKGLKKKIDLSTIIFQIDAPNIFLINLIVRLNAYSIFMVKNLESRHEAGVGVTRIS